jgi:hypothetical protein
MDDLNAVGTREHLFELRNGVLRGDLGALGFLFEEGVHVEAGEGFFGLTQALAAFGLGWD